MRLFLMLLSVTATPAHAFCVHRETGAFPSGPGWVEACCSGRPATWTANDQPVPVVIYEQTPQDVVNDILAAVDTWNTIESSTFRMVVQDARTTSLESEPGQILLGLDPYYCRHHDGCPNGPPLAATGCAEADAFTDNYRITECTILLNGEDFTWGSGPTDQNARRVFTHELGHAMGIMHPGAAPAGPGGQGCGDPLLEATMTCCSGQTEANTLELDDVAAATALYPTWRYTVEVVTSAGAPIEGAAVWMDGTCFPHDGADELEGGMVLGDIDACATGEGGATSPTYHADSTYVTGIDGRTGAFRVLHNAFCFTVTADGYKPSTGCQTLPYPGNYYTTVTLDLDVDLLPCGCAEGDPRGLKTLVPLLLLVPFARRRRARDRGPSPSDG